MLSRARLADFVVVLCWPTVIEACPAGVVTAFFSFLFCFLLPLLNDDDQHDDYRGMAMTMFALALDSRVMIAGTEMGQFLQFSDINISFVAAW